MTKEEKFIKKWERASKNGKKAYIIKMALIFIIIAPFTSALFDLILKCDFSNEAINDVLQVRKIVINIVMFTIVGIFIAYNSWNRGLKKYNIIINYLNNK